MSASNTEARGSGTSAIRIITEIPGPRSRELAERRAKAVGRGLAAAVPIFVARARGATVEDVDGNIYIDFVGGIGVLNAGSGRDDVNAAAHRQLDLLVHSCNQVAMSEAYVTLAERLNEITPGAFPKKTVFFNSGAEAVENAVKIARAATGRTGIVALEHAFHGRTMFALALTGKYDPYKVGFGPFPGEVYRIPSPYTYRCSFGQSPEDCDLACAAELERRLRFEIDPTTIAAVIIEPVQGEGGFIPLTPRYAKKIQETCRRYGILLIVDEIQTGFGRTGKLFACEHWGLEPDLILTAKSLSAGLPLSAVTGRAEVMDVVGPGGVGTTNGGNPVALAAALTVIDVMLREDLPGRAARIGATVRQRFESFAQRYDLVGDVRGIGAMQAFELVRDRTTREPAAAECGRVLTEALCRGLLVIRCGSYGNVIRFLAPLTISDAELNEGLDILEEALSVVNAASRG
jgi:4-aminobutyrate aminotransferase/(S)-3-amino-2-methylpropionate transaminase